MKKFISVAVLVIGMLMCGNNVYAYDGNYALYPTQNMWTFLKLDTRNGMIDIVQYSVKGDEYRFEIPLNNMALVDGISAKQGRFTLTPTQNMYNFILLDTVNGSTWQVQWGTDMKANGMWKISR